MSSSISPLSYTQVTPSTAQSSSSSSSQSGTSSSASSGDITGVSADEGTFLTLLVAQLKNQDPLSPTDSTQFVGELAQFSSLEQLIGINQNVGSITQVIAPSSASSGASSSASGTSTSGTSNDSQSQ